jgi:hypothetical protein
MRRLEVPIALAEGFRQVARCASCARALFALLYLELWKNPLPNAIPSAAGLNRCHHAGARVSL